jgi:hypothetical protein
VFIVHVGGTRGVTWSIDRSIQLHARTTWGVELILAILFIFFLYVGLTFPLRSLVFFQCLTVSAEEAAEKGEEGEEGEKEAVVPVDYAAMTLAQLNIDVEDLDLPPMPTETELYGGECHVVREVDTCWWSSLCNFQYRPHSEHTGLDHLDC